MPGTRKVTPSLPDLVAKKRPMYAYNRVVLTDDHFEGAEVLGRSILWDPEPYLERVLIHPHADESFFVTANRVVSDYAPALKDCTGWSTMNALPPF